MSWGGGRAGEVVGSQGGEGGVHGGGDGWVLEGGGDEKSDFSFFFLFPFLIIVTVENYGDADHG